LISSTVSVQNQTIVANIVSSKPYPRNLLVAFKLLILTFIFEIFDFAHFFVDLQPHSEGGKEIGLSKKKFCSRLT
jgi:hypothetical protein